MDTLAVMFALPADEAVAHGIWLFVLQVSIGLIVFAAACYLGLNLFFIGQGAWWVVAEKMTNWRTRLNFWKYMGMS